MTVTVHLVERPNAPAALIYSGEDKRFAWLVVRRFLTGARGMRAYVRDDGVTTCYHSDWIRDDGKPILY